MCRPKVLVVILGKTVDALVRNLPVFIFFSTFFGTGEDKFGTGERFLVLGRKFGSARTPEYHPQPGSQPVAAQFYWLEVF